MLDAYLMTICGDKAYKTGLRASAIYNWARKHSVAWNTIVCADSDDLLIAMLNDINLQAAQKMLADSEVKLGQKH